MEQQKFMLVKKKRETGSIVEPQANRHISEKMWEALKEDEISMEDYAALLEHTCRCTWCAERLGQAMELSASQPPAYLENEILEKTRQLPAAAAVTLKRTSKRLQLMLYSLKVGVAVACSILLLTATADLQSINLTELVSIERESQAGTVFLDRVNQAANGVVDWMNTATNQLIHGGNIE